jgi:hypothetical protein
MDPSTSQDLSLQNSALPQQTQDQQNVPKRSRLPIVLIILFLFIIVAMVGIIFYKQGKTQVKQNIATVPIATTQKYNLSISHVTSTLSVSPTQKVFALLYPPNSWKTYSNASLHYSLKSPSDWKNTIIQNGGDLYLTSPDYGIATGAAINFFVTHTDQTSVDAEFQEENKSEPDLIPPHNDLLINGIQAIQYDTGPAQKALPIHNTVLVTGGYAYHFATALDQKNENSVLSIYNQILSSFTFIK